MSENGTKFDEAEPLDAILAEMSDGIHTGRADIIDAVNERLLAYAGRIKAAVKREREEVTAARHAFVGVDFAKDKPTYTCVEIAPGNAAAMREALEQAKRDHWFDMSPDLRNKIFAALAASARNCDVGTKEEQHKRFKEFCEERDCHECPFVGNPDCPLDWAQMPFAPAEGGAECSSR